MGLGLPREVPSLLSGVSGAAMGAEVLNTMTRRLPQAPSVRLCPGFHSRSAERTLPLRRNSTALLCSEPFVMQTGRLRPGGDGLVAGHMGIGGELGGGPGA